MGCKLKQAVWPDRKEHNLESITALDGYSELLNHEHDLDTLRQAVNDYVSTLEEREQELQDALEEVNEALHRAREYENDLEDAFATLSRLING